MPNQVTCNCSAYPTFPHRLGGGACKGTEWVQSYQQTDGSACQLCACMNDSESSAQGERFNTCDVEQGLESIKLCEAYQDHLHSQTPVRLPISIESLLVDQWDRFGGAY